VFQVTQRFSKEKKKLVHDIWQRHLDKQFLIRVGVSGNAKKPKVKKKSDKQFLIRVGAFR